MGGKIAASSFIYEVGTGLLAQLEEIALGIRPGGLDGKKLGDSAIGAVISTVVIIGTALPGAKFLHGGVNSMLKNFNLNMGKGKNQFVAETVTEFPIGIGTEVVAELAATGIMTGEWTVGWSAAASAGVETIGTAGAGAAGLGALALMNKPNGFNKPGWYTK
ncbi:hypothetical protein, partial [Kineosporia sp. NBRC 101731]|uniref:hypothetical protein n=1 Tax=Kineosporia sp. NBRC 101731 TaxID=3032199 RepID=UPI0025557576